MTAYALINPSNQIDRRSHDGPGGINPSVQVKAGWKWVPVETAAAPAFNAGLETASQAAPVVEANRVVISYTKTRRSLAEQKAAVKAEAQRRIISLTGRMSLMDCMIKQSNANMRANELNDKRLNGATLTAEEEAEATALRNLAIVIKAIRSKSNEIEALDPIPLDYTADIYWA